MDRRTFVKQTAAVSAVGVTGAVASQPGAADQRRELSVCGCCARCGRYRAEYEFTIDSQEYSTSKLEPADDVQENDDGTTTFTGTVSEGGEDEFTFNGSVTDIKLTATEGEPVIAWDFRGDFDQNNYNRVLMDDNPSRSGEGYHSWYEIMLANYGHISKYEHCERCPNDCERSDDRVTGHVADDIDVWDKVGVQFRRLKMEPYDTMSLHQYRNDDNVR
jgi:hypothetical protein